MWYYLIIFINSRFLEQKKPVIEKMLYSTDKRNILIGGKALKKFIFPVLVLFFLSIPLIVYSGDQWYENGSLHRGSVTDWNRATYANKLATAADWSITIPQIEKKVKKSGSVDTVRPFAIELVACINEAATAAGKDKKVSEIAAMCMIVMGW